MSEQDRDDVGAENAKVPDADIQGVKAGQRNRAATEAGVMPPPAGEPATTGRDPRRETADKTGE
jgi:hypothetical protein